MLKNYFKTARRSLINDKLHSLINIDGLSIGMTVAILIGLSSRGTVQQMIAIPVVPVIFFISHKL